MSKTEKILLAEPLVQKKIIDVLSLFRAEDYAFVNKVLAGAKYYAAKHSTLQFERAVADVNSVPEDGTSKKNR